MPNKLATRPNPSWKHKTAGQTPVSYRGDPAETRKLPNNLPACGTLDGRTQKVRKRTPAAHRIPSVGVRAPRVFRCLTRVTLYTTRITPSGRSCRTSRGQGVEALRRALPRVCRRGPLRA